MTVKCYKILLKYYRTLLSSDYRELFGHQFY